MTACVSCDRLTKFYGPQAVLSDVTWAVAEGDIVGLIGPSGAGKTTLLRIIAGLERCASGRVTFPLAGSLHRPPRGWLSMVFQDHGLWPHLTAWQHVECVLPGSLGRTRRARVEQLLSEMRLATDCWQRRPAELSGGEAQRLALARALAPEPHLLLLDEPLAQVDLPLRAELLAMIRRLSAERQLTVLYVTHSWFEALELCNQLLVLAAGRLAQAGPVTDVFACPVSAAVARLTGPVVEIPGGLIEAGRVQAPPGVQTVRDGDAILVRPQQVHFAAPQGPNCWKVIGVRPYGQGWRVSLQSESLELSVFSAKSTALDATVALVLASASATPRNSNR
ncbi:MAG: ABC transporter ATP-binding protein [Planctomycetaceae bacterium]|nr:ABC transporter ATP-binding protein [Planctomycetaceae bacterium]